MDLRAVAVSPDLVDQLTLNRPELKRPIRVLETTLAHFVEQFGGRPLEFRMAGEDLYDDRKITLHKLAAVRHLLGVRLGANLTEVVESLSNQRTLSLAQAVRATFETAGAAAYYEAKFRASSRDLISLKAQVNRALYGQRFEWGAWKEVKSREHLGSFLRERTQRVGLDPNRPPSVMTFVDALANRITTLAQRHREQEPLPGHVRAIYEQLCDFVHPSVGTWLTYGQTDRDSFAISISSQSRMESMQFLWFGIGDCVAGIACVGLDALNEIQGLRSAV